VVGVADVSSGGPTHAFLFFENRITDLNELVDPTLPLLTQAADINEGGQIVATGLNGHGYLLTPRKK
jgi:probable HAF family extracellular repeat protein